MNDLIPKTLNEVLEKLAELDGETPTCPMAADEAYTALDREPAFQVYTLNEIAKRHDFEPWAAQVAADWLRENGL